MIEDRREKNNERREKDKDAGRKVKKRRAIDQTF